MIDGQLEKVVSRFIRFCSLALGTFACGAAGMVLKPPVQQRCEAAGLKGCPEVVDGVMAYVEGNEATATEKLRAGAAQNSPEDVRKFAQSLLEVSGLPGASEFAGPVTRIAKLLATQASAKGSVQKTVADTAVVPAPAVATAHPGQASLGPSQDRADLAMLALTAPVDPTRTETESLSFTGVTAPVACEVAGTAALCVSRRTGPLMVTDLLALSGCPGRLFLGVSVAVSGALGLRWFAEATSAGLTGARLFVNGGEWLQVIFVPNAKADPRDPRCVLTWSGFRPRMVPTNAQATAVGD